MHTEMHKNENRELAAAELDAITGGSVVVVGTPTGTLIIAFENGRGEAVWNPKIHT